jgi:hypothetical protein
VREGLGGGREGGGNATAGIALVGRRGSRETSKPVDVLREVQKRTVGRQGGG